ncbi:lipopolysaccharide assembly protein LapA domain-containing protein [Aeromicrobium sp. Leaf350]|uniref:lipopolysaccharide assembly protein LapA domain-containing protein n=1 Tax=Aeromicrobium sp. Leaf350 TaxID=2876565 RepID=UPI001E28CF44|nr:lipopolysaccharide assembly protein LapA domain-containing protein [Aeromicrobium sp. Leaf350]
MSGQNPLDPPVDQPGAPIEQTGPDGPITTPASSSAVDPAVPQTSEPAPRRRSGLDDKGRVKRTRAATAWASAVALAVVTVLFVIFIVQNSQSVTIDFLWMSGQISAAAALLIAAVAGALLVAIPAGVRIGQLRHSLRRNA